MDNEAISQRKKELYEELLDLMIKGLESGALSVEESEKASAFITTHLEAAVDEVGLKATVEDLATFWPAFKSALLSLESQESKNEDQHKIEETQKALEDLKSQE